MGDGPGRDAGPSIKGEAVVAAAMASPGFPCVRAFFVARNHRRHGLGGVQARRSRAGGGAAAPPVQRPSPCAPPSLRFSPCGGGRRGDARPSSQDSRTRAGRLWRASRAALRPGGSTRSAGGRDPAPRPGPAAPSGAENGAALCLYTNAIRCRDRSRDGERSPPTAAPTPPGAAPVARGKSGGTT